MSIFLKRLIVLLSVVAVGVFCYSYFTGGIFNKPLSPKKTVSFSVDDIESIVDGLTERGVAFEQYDFDEIKTDERGIAVLGNLKAAWFYDSEGNIIGIMQQG